MEILTDSYDTIYYKFKEKSLVLYSYCNERLKDIARQLTETAKFYSLTNQIFQVAYEKAQLIKLLENGKSLKSRLFPGLKISNILENPADQSYFLIYRATEQEKELRAQEIQRTINAVTSVKVYLTQSAMKGLQLQDPTHPHYTLLQKLLLLHKSESRLTKVKLEKFSSRTMPRTEAIQTEREEGKVPSESELSSIELSLHCDLKQKYEYLLQIVSPSTHEMRKIIADLENLIHTLDNSRLEMNFLNRKFEHMPYEQPLTKFEKEIIGAFKSVDYPKLQRHLGANQIVTEAKLQLEQKYNVIINLVRIRDLFLLFIFGYRTNVKHSAIELCLELKALSLQKQTLPLDSIFVRILQKGHLNELSHRLSTQYQICQIFFTVRSAEKLRGYVNIYTREGYSENALALVQNCLGELINMIEVEVIFSECWPFRSKIEAFLVLNESKVHIERNETEDVKYFNYPKYEKTPTWVKSNLSEEVYKPYDLVTNMLIQSNYSKGDHFFTVGGSNYSVAKGREDTWSEITPSQRFKIKRLAVWQVSQKFNSILIKPRQHLLLGSKEEIHSLKIFLRKFMAYVETKQSYQTLTIPYNEDLAQRVEDQFEVGVSETPDHRMIRVVGDLHKEAAMEYQKLSHRSSEISAQFIKMAQEEETIQAIVLFKERWSYGKLPKIKSAQKLEESQQLRRFMRERSRFFQKSSNHDIELYLFQLEFPKYKCEFAWNSSYFFDLDDVSQRFYNIPDSSERQTSLIIHRVLLGNKFKVKGDRTFLAPPTRKASQIHHHKSNHRQFLMFDLLFSDQERSRRLLQDKDTQFKFYDTVEVKTEKGLSYWVFHSCQSYPAYKVTFTRQK